MARAIIYTRVSTDKQEANGDSLEVQQQDCEADCRRYEVDVVGVESDTYSGHNSLYDRPGLQRALERIRRGEADLLVVKRISRMVRDQADAQVLLRDVGEAGGTLRSVVEGMTFHNTADDKLLMGIHAFQAEKDWETIRAQSQQGLQSRVAKGRPLVSVPLFGYCFEDAERGQKYRNKATMVVDPESARIVQFIFARAAAGWSTRSISTELNRLGYITPSALSDSRGQRGERKLSRSWGVEMVRSILKNESYTGRHGSYRTKWTRIKGSHGSKSHYKVSKRDSADVVSISIPALIDDATWESAQSKISMRQVNTALGDVPLLNQGFAICGACGTRMRAARQYKAGGYRVYRCCNDRPRPGYEPCASGHYVVKADAVDRDIWSKVKAIILDEAKWQRLVKTKSARLEEEHANAVRGVETYRAELSEMEVKQPKVYQNMVDEDDLEIKAMHRVELKRVNEIIAQLKKKIDAATAALEETEDRRNWHAELVAKVKLTVAHYRAHVAGTAEHQEWLEREGIPPEHFMKAVEGLVDAVEETDLDKLSREDKRGIIRFMDVKVRMFPKNSEYAKTHDTRWEFSWADAPSQECFGHLPEHIGLGEARTDGIHRNAMPGNFQGH